MTSIFYRWRCIFLLLCANNLEVYRREKYEKLKAGPPKHEFNDPEYFRTREKILEEADEAFEAGNRLLIIFCYNFSITF